MHHLDDEIGAEARIRLAFRRRQLHSGEAVLAVPELRGDQLLVERVLRPRRNRDIAASRQGHDLERVLQALCRLHIAGHHR